MSDITLEEWDRRKFDPPHSISTLRGWARAGRIHPKPQLVGREYRVEPDAEYVSPGRKTPVQAITVLESQDPIVNDIIRGQTQKRRQA